MHYGAALTSVHFSERYLWVDFSDDRIVGVPISWFPKLMKASADEREDVQVSSEGAKWDKIDESISIEQLLFGRSSCSEANREGRASHQMQTHVQDGEAVSSATLRMWSTKPHLNVHKIIALSLELFPIRRQEFVSRIEQLGITQNGYGAVGSLMTNKGNAYGRVFVDQGGLLAIHPRIEEELRSLRWI